MIRLSLRLINRVTSAMGKPGKIRLFVGGLDFRAGKAHVESLLSPFGKVSDVFLPLYRRHKGDGQRNRGYAFAEMARQEGLVAIKELNETTDPSTDRTLTVREAARRQTRKRRR